MAEVSSDRQLDIVEQMEEIWQTFRQRANGGRGLTPAEAAALNELVAAGAQAAAEMVAEEEMAATEERSRRTRTSSTGGGVRGKSITATVLDEANVFAQLWNADDETDGQDGPDDQDKSETFFDRYTEGVRLVLERSKKALGPAILITTQRCWEDMVRADVQARADALSEGDLVTLGKSHRRPYRHPEQKKHTYRHPQQKKQKR
jgi:hypothetical protein